MRPHPAPAHFYTCWKFPCTKRQVSAFNSTRHGFRLTMAKKRSRTPQPPPTTTVPSRRLTPAPTAPSPRPTSRPRGTGLQGGPGEGDGWEEGGGGRRGSRAGTETASARPPGAHPTRLQLPRARRTPGTAGTDPCSAGSSGGGWPESC